jgi:hypothetical protein
LPLYKTREHPTGGVKVLNKRLRGIKQTEGHQGTPICLSRRVCLFWSLENEDTTLILVLLGIYILNLPSYSGKGHPLGYGLLIMQIGQFSFKELLPGQKWFMI